MTARPRLQSLIFEVTQQCNHACGHCYNVWQGGSSYPRSELDTSRTLELLAKALKETDCPHVTLTGGEPLLRKDLFEILEFLQRRHVRMTLISNGRLLDGDMVAHLMERGVGLFELPLLSHRREVHDELSGVKGAWDRVLAAMAEARLRHAQVVAAFVATRRNIDHIYETLRMAFAFGARGVMLNRFNPGGRGRANLEELLPSVNQMKQALETAEAASVEFNLPISCSIPIQPCLIDTSRFPHLGFGYCSAGTERAYYTLDPLGNVRPCNHTDISLGNLFEASFADLVEGREMAGFKCARPDHCRGCAKEAECQGGCKASAQVCYGSLLEEEPFLHLNRAHSVPLSASLP